MNNGDISLVSPVTSFEPLYKLSHSIFSNDNDYTFFQDDYLFDIPPILTPGDSFIEM